METIITTQQGAVQGALSQDQQTVIFRGVPYAQPPVGALRFRRPQEHAPWEGVRDCTAFGPRCPQADLASMDFYGKEFYRGLPDDESEDCLYLNVWTPAVSTEDKLPVYVWYFGGGLQWGNPAEMEFDGERLARRGIVVVTVNYRLNIFGYFAHPELTLESPQGASGNYGLLDQIQALVAVLGLK